MKKLKFTIESLPDFKTYYQTHFQEDLRSYFYVKEDENGYEYIENVSLIRPTIPFVSVVRNEKKSTERDRRYMTIKEQFMFGAILAVVYSFELYIFRKNHGKMSESKKILHQLNLPWIELLNSLGGLGYFIERVGIYSPNYRQELKILKDAISIAESFVLTEFAEKIKFLDNDFGLQIHESNLKELISLYIKISPSSGLAMNFDEINFELYYKERFEEQLRLYFKIGKWEGNEIIFSFDKISNLRWDDGCPGANAAENMMFSITLLSWYIDQQSVLAYSPESEVNEFIKVANRPRLYTGPGGGDCLHPLAAIEYAGLLPNKEETALYLKMFNLIRQRLQEETNHILNKETLTPSITKSRRLIKKRIDEELDSVISVLNTWKTSQYESIKRLVEPLQYDFDNK